jgi:hypothetical protein
MVPRGAAFVERTTSSCQGVAADYNRHYSDVMPGRVLRAEGWGITPHPFFVHSRSFCLTMPFKDQSSGLLIFSALCANFESGFDYPAFQ